MTQLKPGLKLKSAVCNGEVMIIKSAGGEALTCGGAAMLAAGDSARDAALDSAQMAAEACSERLALTSNGRHYTYGQLYDGACSAVGR